MAKTTPQMSIHEIRLGKPKKGGETNMVKPNTPFDCPDDDLKFLQEAGACRDLTEDEASRFSGGSKAAAKADDTQDDDADEQARLDLIAEAKAMGIKGIRKDFTVETVQEKIDEFKAAQEDDNDVDDDATTEDEDDEDDEDVVG